MGEINNMCKKIIRDDINRIFGISESYMLPDRLMQILLNKSDMEAVFNEFLAISPDLSEDWFTDYFQENHSNRDAMAQDFTPESIRMIVSGIAGNFTKCGDICAGTGGLTIAMYNKNPNAEFYCVELSKRALPLLIFNLAIRNINAIIVNQDVLTEEVFGAYKLTKNEKFSDITEIYKVPDFSADLVVMNPPYSLKHKWDEKRTDNRFCGYGYPPNNFSDYAFVLHGLNMLVNGGELIAILPHGVLFRGGKEGTIRRKLVENKLIDSVIGLPENLFLNTGIPTFILKLKHKNSESILFIDAKKEFEKKGKISVIPKNSAEKIIETAINRRVVEKFSGIIGLGEIEYNDYNLNISRYISDYEPEPVPDLVETICDIKSCSEEITKLNKEILGFMKELRATNTDVKDDELNDGRRLWEAMINGL